uniref:Uncharacterized protein n=1 Tax=Arundo donax TaxID=35708 RepID=A0A0A9C9G9_ARUDO
MFAQSGRHKNFAQDFIGCMYYIIGRQSAFRYIPGY